MIFSCRKKKSGKKGKPYKNDKAGCHIQPCLAFPFGLFLRLPWAPLY